MEIARRVLDHFVYSQFNFITKIGAEVAKGSRDQNVTSIVKQVAEDLINRDYTRPCCIVPKFF